MVESDTRALHLTAPARAAERLQARRAAGELTGAAVRQAARELGISERTMWRALNPAQAPVVPRALPSDWLERYQRWGGNAAAVWRELEAEGGAGCSRREVQRRFAELLTAGDRAAARGGGEQGRRAHSLHLRWEAEHRNEVWQADHKQLDVLVIAPGHSRPRAPWVTWCLDDHSRAVMGWALSLHPSSAEVLAALRASMLGAPLGGRPRRLRVDNGLEFTAQAIREACAALDIELDLTRAYRPQEKGKVERLHRTLKDTLLAGLPHFTGGPRAANGQLEAPGTPLLLSQLVELFAAWVDDYNARPHSALAGRSPLEAFAVDPTPLRELTDEQARTLLLARGRPGASRRDPLPSSHLHRRGAGRPRRRDGADRLRPARRPARRGLPPRHLALHRPAAPDAHASTAERGPSRAPRARPGSSPPPAGRSAQR